MERQKVMEESFQRAHRDFISSLSETIDLLEKDIGEAAEMQQICTDEWCKATEHYLDELGKSIFSISEPRWLGEEDSNKIKELRKRLHDLYAQFKNAKSA